MCSSDLSTTRKQETADVFLENTDSVGESVEESVVKLEMETSGHSSSSESDYLDGEETEARGESLFKDTLQSFKDNQLFDAEAISGPERQQWLQAMAEELQSFNDNQVWEVVDAPDNVSTSRSFRSGTIWPGGIWWELRSAASVYPRFCSCQPSDWRSRSDRKSVV